MTFDFEKIDVYRLILEAIDKTVKVALGFPRGYAYLADQLKRAISSAGLNTAEGIGEYKSLEKARFYRMALRSISESCSIIQIGFRLKIISEFDYQDLYTIYTRISKMLTKLVHSMHLRKN